MPITYQNAKSLACGNVYLDPLSRQVVDGNLRELGKLFAAEALDPPAVVWGPGRDGLPVEPLPFLLDYWRALPREGDLPALSAMDVTALQPALGHLMLLEVLDQGRDFLYRVYGTRIAERSGFDMTGRRTSDIHTSRCVNVFFLTMYRAAMARREAVYTRHNPPPEISSATWDRLVLPLVDRQGAVARLLVGNVAGEWRSTSNTGTAS